MAVKKFIDSTGLATLWEKVKALIPGIATSSKAGIVKSGGDITVASDGAVTVNDNSHNHFYEKGVFYGASGTGGYINFCTITVNSAYRNEPFSLELSSRSRLGTLTINLSLGGSTTITAPSLVWISDLVEAAPVWYKVDGDKLYLYWQKSEAYDEMSVTGLNIGLYTYKGVTFSWGNTYVTATTGLTNVPKSGYKVTCLNFNSENASGYTIDSFWVNLLYKSGCVGSVYLGKKSSGVGSDIVEGWYNFVYMPYGDGASVAGFRSYGSIILTPMTMSTSSWVLRVTNSSSTVTEAVKLTKYSIADISGLQAALDGKSSTSHSHGLSHTNNFAQIDDTTTDSGYSMIDSNWTTWFQMLKSVRTQTSAPSWALGNHSSGIAFGGQDTKGIITHAYDNPKIKFAGGNGNTFKWNMTISGTSGTTYDLSKLATKTNLTDGSVTKVGTATLGSTTKPIYLSSGVPTTGSTYAGGTKVTLNGTSRASSTATFYAPTTYGSNGHVLIAKGSGAAPTFTDALQVVSNGQQEALGDLAIHFYRPTTYRQIQLIQAGAVAEFDYSSYSSAAVSSTSTIKFVSTSGHVFQRSVVPVFFHKGAKLMIDECTTESSSATSSEYTTVTYTAKTSGLVFVGAWPYTFHLSSHEIFDKTLVISSLSDSRLTTLSDSSYMIDLSSDNILYDSIVFDISGNSYPIIYIGGIKMNNIPNCHVVKLYAKNGRLGLYRSDADYRFATTNASNSYYTDRNCYTEVMWYGKRWLTKEY